jgi:hypothetical protein
MFQLTNARRPPPDATVSRPRRIGDAQTRYDVPETFHALIPVVHSKLLRSTKKMISQIMSGFW